jgi:outer membrane receptor for ferrienterochelin and colicins
LNYEGKFGKNNVQSTLAFNAFDREKNAYRTDLESNTQDFVIGEQDTSRFNALLSRTTFSRAINPNVSLLSGIEFYGENAFGKKIQDSTENKPNFAQMLDLGAFIGGKFDFFNKKLALQPTVRYGYNSKYTAPLTPSLNALFQVNTNWKIRASYARGFRAPSLKELYFNFIDVNHYIVGQTNIKAEKSHNIVINPSFSKNYGKVNLNLEGNIFYNDIQNRIILAEYEQLKYRYDNLAEYRTKGAGLNLTLAYADIISWKSSAVYTGYYNTARDEQPELPVYLYSPDFSSDLTVTIPSIQLTMNVLYRHTGAMPTYNFGKNGVIEEGRLSSWNLLNATVGKQFFKGKVSITTGVKNILNIQNIVSQGAIGVGHGASARDVPVNFGKSYFVKMAVTI